MIALRQKNSKDPTPMILRTLGHNRTKGQALVEAAFVLFILVLLAFGITEFGRAMYTKNSLTNAARTGARQAVVTPNLINETVTLNANCNYTCPPVNMSDPVNGCVYQAVCNSLSVGIIRDQVSVAVSGAGSPVATGNTIRVDVTYGTAGQANTGFQSVVPKLIPITNVLTVFAAMRYE
jgi:Flp pilus assembly protein TadG